MTNESGTAKKAALDKSNKRRFGWPVAVFVLILGVLAGLGVVEYQAKRDKQAQEIFNKEKARLEKELQIAKDSLRACETKLTCAKPKKKYVRKVSRYVAPKPPVSTVKVEEKMFDSRTCGEGTEAMISKITGKPECRAIVAASVPTSIPRVTRVVEQPKPEMICEKPNIRELRDDGSIACVALPVAQAVSQMPPGCFTDPQGRLMCPRSIEAKSEGSWIPWAVGAAVLGIAINNYGGKDKGHKNRTPPGVSSLPPGPGFTSPGLGVATLPPEPRLTSPGPGL